MTSTALSTKDKSCSSSSESAISISSMESPLVPVSEDVKKVLDFESVQKLAEFYKSLEWHPFKELQIILDIIENADNDITRLRALKMFQDRRMEVLQNSGLVVSAQRTGKTADGSRLVFSTSMVAAALGQPIKEKESENGKRNDREAKKGVHAGARKKTLRVSKKTGRTPKPTRASTRGRNKSGTDSGTSLAIGAGTVFHQPPASTDGESGFEAITTPSDSEEIS